VAEGGALLRRYTGKTRIEGSNPSLSANQSSANRLILRTTENEPSFQNITPLQSGQFPSLRGVRGL
jgi:hypothetical protein